ncbi:hypothetical protein ACFV9W_23195 [Streptomyces sp. NPDC059897]|uniref:hypothetical protein n=1 Tax=Streptomyces sp. NPDC059897 TaxID=3346994 RepID=UPI0036488DFD
MKRPRPLRTARRRLSALRRRARSALLRRLFLPWRGQRAAVLRYAAVLDGQTVNLHARLPRWAGPDDGARIELLRKGVRRTAPARVYTDHDGAVAMDAAILLGQEVGGLAVDTGHWDIRLRLSEGARRKSLSLLLVDMPKPYGGPTRPMQVSGVTGARYRLGRTVTGSARLECSPPSPMAEVVRIAVSHSEVEVFFRVVGAEPRGTRVEFVASGRRLEEPVDRLDDGLFRVAAPLHRMTPRGDRPEQWDVVLRADGLPAMRLGRRLHDVRNPTRVFAVRESAVTGRDRTPLLVQPRYTPAGNFRIKCSPMTEAA